MLAYVRKLAREPVTKRRQLIALTRDYVDVLETELAAETASRRNGSARQQPTYSGVPARSPG